MAERKRIQWSEHEQDEVYSAFLQLKDKEKLKLPPTHWTEMSKVMKVLNHAQLSLPTGRRRNLSGIVAIPPYLLSRMQGSGYLPRNMKPLQKGYKPEGDEDAAPDPRDTRIKELEQKIEELNQREMQLLGQNQNMVRQIENLQNQPTPMQLIQRFVAETLAMALTQAEDAKKPAGIRVAPPEVGERRKPEGPLPQFERERRKDPAGFAQSLSGIEKERKPKIAVLGGMDKDYALIQEQLGPVAEMRYLDTPNKIGDSLKHFNANGGRVVVWTTFASHGFTNALKGRGITFHSHSGTLPQLIEHLKGMVKE